ncbi:hypothetical protein [Paraburkholderia sp. MM6662-R1]|uniref:hypothetical protein n=1 Tax=Paraburkholderia sp. MM6662-R1 TaxID=2991066 RepID=UPI003D1B1F30
MKKTAIIVGGFIGSGLVIKWLHDAVYLDRGTLQFIGAWWIVGMGVLIWKVCGSDD